MHELRCHYEEIGDAYYTAKEVVSQNYSVSTSLSTDGDV